MQSLEFLLVYQLGMALRHHVGPSLTKKGAKTLGWDQLTEDPRVLAC
jgi:hypothetical protein